MRANCDAYVQPYGALVIEKQNEKCVHVGREQGASLNLNGIDGGSKAMHGPSDRNAT